MDDDQTGGPTPTERANLDTTMRWFRDGATGQVELADTIFSSDFRTNGRLVGPEGPKRNVRNRLAGFPDFALTVEEQIASGDAVVSRLRWSGTHLGPYSGLAPTGRRVDVLALTIFHFDDGQVVENWTVIDQFGLFEQLGALPPELPAQVPRSTG